MEPIGSASAASEFMALHAQPLIPLDNANGVKREHVATIDLGHVEAGCAVGRLAVVLHFGGHPIMFNDPVAVVRLDPAGQLLVVE